MVTLEPSNSGNLAIPLSGKGICRSTSLASDIASCDDLSDSTDLTDLTDLPDLAVLDEVIALDDVNVLDDLLVYEDILPVVLPVFDLRALTDLLSCRLPCDLYSA